MGLGLVLAVVLPLYYMLEYRDIKGETMTTATRMGTTTATTTAPATVMAKG